MWLHFLSLNKKKDKTKLTHKLKKKKNFVSCAQCHCCAINEVRMPRGGGCWRRLLRKCLLSGQISGVVLPWSRDSAALPFLWVSSLCAPARSSPLALALWGFHEGIFTAGGRWWACGMVLRRKRCGLPVCTVTQTRGSAFLWNTLSK